MCATLLLLQTRTWNHWSAEVIEEARSGRARVVSLDPITACILRTHCVPFDSIDDFEPQQSWEQTNEDLYELLMQLSSGDDQEDIEIFSHYLIAETNLLFDRLLRIRTMVEAGRPATLAIGANASDTAANELYAVAAQLPWPTDLQIHRWDLQGPLRRG